MRCACVGFLFMCLHFDGITLPKCAYQMESVFLCLLDVTCSISVSVRDGLRANEFKNCSLLLFVRHHFPHIYGFVTVFQLFSLGSLTRKHTFFPLDRTFWWVNVNVCFSFHSTVKCECVCVCACAIMLKTFQMLMLMRWSSKRLIFKHAPILVTIFKKKGDGVDIKQRVSQSLEMQSFRFLLSAFRHTLSIACHH